MKPEFVVVGCGRLGTMLGSFLSIKGYPVAGAASRSEKSARHAAGLFRTKRASTLPWEVTPFADLVFITTPDAEIENVCRQIAEHGGFRPKSIVLHCSGAMPSTILEPARQNGAFIGSFHPLQTFPFVPRTLPDEEQNPFSKIVISVEGDPEAYTLSASLARDLGAVCHRIRTDGKTLYHAAAVVASNYLVTLADLFTRLIIESGIDEKDAFSVLKPLIYSTLKNIETSGPEKALTGPIARGDIKTVAGHVREIGEKAPLMLRPYCGLGESTVKLAKNAGAIDFKTAQKLMNIFNIVK